MVQTASGEVCERNVTTAPMCSSMMPGSTGFVNCKDCKWDFSMCVKAAGPSGGTGSPGTGGTGTTGTGGTGTR